MIKEYPSTKRFIIENNVREYNRILKNTQKKFYVENRSGDKLISFFRRNNKVLLNFERLNEFELNFVKENIDDILFNTEVVFIGDMTYLLEDLKQSFVAWNGNVIVNK
jgi:hypothetical protein